MSTTNAPFPDIVSIATDICNNSDGNDWLQKLFGDEFSDWDDAGVAHIDYYLIVHTVEIRKYGMSHVKRMLNLLSEDMPITQINLSTIASTIEFCRMFTKEQLVSVGI